MDNKRLAETLLLCEALSDNLLPAVQHLKFVVDIKGSLSHQDSIVGSAHSPTGNNSGRSLSSNRSETLRIFSDATFAKINLAFVKKFPENPDLSKIQGYSQFTTDARTLGPELQQSYQTLKEVADFTQLASSTLLSFDRLSGLNFIHHHMLIRPFFRVLTNFVYIQLMMGELGNERRIIAAAFNWLMAYDTKNTDPYFPRIAKYLNDYDKPQLYMQDVFAPIGITITSLLQSLFSEHMAAGMVSVEILRKDADFTIYAKDRSQEFDEKKFRMLPTFNDFASYVVAATLVCPMEILKQQGCLDIFKVAISDRITLTITRSETLYISAEFDALVKANQKLAKIKTAVAESLGSGLQKAVEFHQNRRTYLRFALRQAFFILADKRYIASAKFANIIALLSLATEELKWYFLHTDRVISARHPKFAPKAPAVVQPFDLSVIELLSSVYEIKQVLIRESYSIKEYNSKRIVSMFSTVLANTIDDLLQKNNTDEIVKNVFKTIVSDVEDSSANSVFEGLRVNYMRLLVHFLSVDSSVALSTISNFTILMNQLCAMTRIVDCTSEVIEEACNTKWLFTYRGLLLEHHDEIMKQQHPSMQYVQVIPKIASGFTENLGSYFTKEVDRVGMRSLEFVEDFFGNHASWGSNYLHAIAAHKLNHDNQILPEETVKFAPDRREKKKKASEVPIEAGLESLDDNSHLLGGLSLQQQAVRCVIRSFAEFDKVTVYDGTVYPQEWIKSAIYQKAKSFLTAQVLNDDVQPTSPRESNDESPFNMQRPTKYLNNLASYISAIEFVNDISRLNLTNVVVHAIREQVDMVKCRKDIQDEVTPKQKQKGKKVPTNSNAALLINFSLWYTELLRDRGSGGSLVLSELRKSITSPGESFAVSAFTNPAELTALCEIVGPSGVKLMDERLLNLIYIHCKEIKDILMTNGESFAQIYQALINDAPFNDTIKKLKYFDELVQKAMNVGLVLGFRDMLFDALQRALDKRAPFIMSTMKNASQRYPANIFGHTEFFALDTLCNFVGLTDGDLALRALLQPLCRNPQQDSRVFQAFPIVFALAIRQLAVDDKTVYNVRLDAFDNGAHLVPHAFSKLITYFTAISDPGEMDILVSRFKQCLQLSTRMLLRIKSETQQHQEAIKGALILLLKFVKHSSQFVDESELEEFIPYQLSRMAFADFFRKSGSTVKIVDKEQGQTAAENPTAEA